jgi:hypothetical protein
MNAVYRQVKTLDPAERPHPEDLLNAFYHWVWDMPAYQLAEFHAGRCAMCAFMPEPDRYFVDHDRVSGLVRGFLCHSCNSAEAHPKNLEAPHWLAYRSRPPAKILDFTAQYRPGGFRTRNIGLKLCWRGLVERAKRERLRTSDLA